MKFKVGDRVRVSGCLGKVIRVDNSSQYPITVSFEGKHYSINSFNYSELEKIEMKPKIVFSEGTEAEISKETEDNMRKAFDKPKHNIPQNIYVGQVYKFPDGGIRMWAAVNGGS